jgi:hypothetical protein
MSKIVTLRLSERTYNLFRSLAKHDNRTLSNFIETSALRHVEENGAADDAELEAIRRDSDLSASLRRAHSDAKARRGRLVG